MSNDNEVKCLAVGLGLGVIAGLLFAPRSGEESRQMIESKFREGREYLRDQAGQIADATNDAVDRGARTIRHQKENVEAAVEAGKKAYQENSAVS